MNALLGASVLVCALLMTPLTLRVRVAWQGTLTGVAVLRAWQVPLRLAFHTVKTSGGTRLMLRRHSPPKPETPAPPPNRRTLAMVGAFFRADKVRYLLRRGVHLSGLELRAHLALRDAAGTALLTGAAATFLSVARQVSGRNDLALKVEPDFWSDHSRLELACAVRTRLGTVLLALAAMLLAFILEAREHRPAAPAQTLKGG